MLEFSHKPVMLEECMEGLNLKDGGIWYDATVGGGGHSYEILKRTATNGRLIATDLDDEAIAAATERLKEFEGRFHIYKSNYKDNKKVRFLKPHFFYFTHLIIKLHIVLLFF